ncbi:maleylpyruvate isomerase family mycothiol-dependent enzyme [Intrasporangium calvum]|uniref:maleylpyruvate isomerase family mycothiol-dependent enzyme n=1 Tax=Intrasporangium calvum TaxID=53358 RepID=UPI000DF63F7E|nr:maleylpyruvate isomerase family mycothiol-dependent enzyme [Intrasporangium calvum]AXG12083.1 maleylpyruvate isomerase family mycothiol-dependent enzyme [Intrasporangium calvum]
MPLHPAAPDDQGGLLDAFEQVVQAIVDLGWACREEDFEKPTECPGWTVKDHMVKVVATEKAFAALPREPHGPANRAEVRNEFNRMVDLEVAARRQWTGRSVISELADFHQHRMSQLRSLDVDLDTEIAGFFRERTTFGDQLRAQITETWVHEQDVRTALDRPGNLDSPAAAVFTAAIVAALPLVAVRDAGIEPGSAVVLDVTGPVLARGGARVVEGPDGRPVGEALFSGQDPEAGEPLDVTTIQLTTEALTRRAAGRRTRDEIHFTILGDESVGHRILDALDVLGPAAS